MPFIRCITMAALVAAFAGLCGPLRAAEAKRQAVPDANAVRDASKQVRQVFREDLAAAILPAEKSRLAGKLLSASGGEKNPVVRYAMLSMSIDMACNAGDLDRAAQGVAKMAEIYEEDADQCLVQAAGDAAKNVKTQEARNAYFECTQKMVGGWEARNEFALARKVAEYAVTAMRGAPDLLASATEQAADVRETELAWERCKKLVEAAEFKAEKIAHIGRYLCFYRDNWEQGLPLLAACNDAPLHTLAAAELKKEAAPEALLAVAEGWEKQAEKLGNLGKRQVRAHAEAIYRDILPKLGGLAKIKVENRLKVIEARQAGVAGPAVKLAKAAYVGEFSGRFFAEGVPDELTLAAGGRGLRISGVKKTDTASIQNRTCGHFGKIGMLMGVARRTGELGVVVASQGDHTCYGLHLIKADGSLESQSIILKPDEKYSWQTQIENGNLVLRVKDVRNEVATLHLPAGQVRGIGFSATVRHVGDKADLQVKW